MDDEHSQIKNQTGNESSKLGEIDFWTSRGNLGEKMNIILGFNVSILHLLSSLVLDLENSKILSNQTIEELNNIKSITEKLLENPKSTPQLHDQVEKLNNLLITILEGKIIDKSILRSPRRILEEETEKIGLFSRNIDFTDRWGILEHITTLFTGYSNLSHLAIPKYYFTACQELLKYESGSIQALINSNEVIQIPVLRIQALIAKLLREAPSARLLQNLKKMYPNDEASLLTPDDELDIMNVVKRYFESISKYAEGSYSLSDSFRISEGILQNYNLGAGDLESRIPNISYIIAKETYNDLNESIGNDFKQLINSETVILIHRLNDSILNNNRFKTFLRSLK
ncbi:MAG: hypothetical protein EAX86_07175 [Candidatus Heimdallarchaeota archaeon]|nr:hypothetical protein [Candidatus Heimdallarchaeota archaeon]